MNDEIEKLEEIKQAELQLMQQVYEQKINYLSTKLQLLQKENDEKDNKLQELLSQENQQDDLPKLMQALEDERDKQKRIVSEYQEKKIKEINYLKNNYASELQTCYNLVKQKEKSIEKLRKELSNYQIKRSNYILDIDKVEYMSKIIEISNELLVLL